MRRYFDNISVDLMFCLPGQNWESLKRTLDRVEELDPCHISAYILKIYESTPFARSFSEADDDISSDMYLGLCSYLEEKGYSHYEISSFCRDGRYSRHNLLYWSGGEYIGFGPGAHGYENGVRYMYEQDIGEYIRQGGKVSTKIHEKIGPDEKKREEIIFGLRTSFGVQLADFGDDKKEFIDRMKKEGLCKITEGRLALTDKGMLVSNSIISGLI